MPVELSPVARAVLDALQEGVVVVDDAGRLVFANQAAYEVIAGLGDGALSGSGELLTRLTDAGARVAPLRIDDHSVGHAAFLSPGQAGRDTLAERERQAILLTLEDSGWRLAESARRLGISRTTLWRRLKEYGLRRDGRGRWSRAS